VRCFRQFAALYGVSLMSDEYAPMPSRIVTYAHRHKRPPRKAQAAAVTGPAIVKATSERIRRREEADDGQETAPEIKAFFARMMRPPGT
jgi:hypothetical protein